jgi:hypothetical protein
MKTLDKLPGIVLRQHPSSYLDDNDIGDDVGAGLKGETST